MRPATEHDIAETWRMLMGMGQALEMVAVRRTRKVPVPFTVLGGFLGAGKTTVMNRLLSGAGGLRLSMLVNDFGSVNIDAALIRRRGADVLELTNGCACCSIAGGLVNAVDRVLEASSPPDAIVLEASGVADPSAIARITSVDLRLSLNAILTVADAERIFELLVDPDVAGLVERQLRAADILVLSKTDLIDRERLLAVETDLRNRYPTTGIVRVTEEGSLPPIMLLEPAVNPQSRSWNASGFSAEGAFTTHKISLSYPFDPTALGKLLDNPPIGFLRAKGFLYLARNPYPALLQAVGSRWSLQECTFEAANDGDAGIIVIGTAGRFDSEAFASAFLACGSEM